MLVRRELRRCSKRLPPHLTAEKMPRVEEDPEIRFPLAPQETLSGRHTKMLETRA